jgi:serine/threonine protein kinase
VVLKGYLKQKEERALALAQEIALLRELEHENIIRLEGVFESEQAVYLVFERLTGGTLLERINSQRGLSIEEARTVLRGIAEGLAYLHRFGIAHRDLKLENIILRDQYSLRPVIADFGLAVLVEEQPYFYYRCGTPGYVAPEIIRMRENKPAQVSCDIFSAGAIFHLLLTNSYLFPGSNSEEVYRLNCQAKVVLKGEKYNSLDTSALDLLQKMLILRVSDRISA